MWSACNKTMLGGPFVGLTFAHKYDRHVPVGRNPGTLSSACNFEAMIMV